MSKRPKAKKYRARNEIIEDMLNAALDVATKTKIMYKAYLSGAQLKEYLPFALERDLLEYDKDRGLHFVTMKGRAFLRKINDLEDMIGNTCSC